MPRKLAPCTPACLCWFGLCPENPNEQSSSVRIAEGEGAGGLIQEGSVCHLLFGDDQLLVFWLACRLNSLTFPTSPLLSQLAFRNLAEDTFLPGCHDPAVRWMCEQALLSPLSGCFVRIPGGVC